MCRSSWSWICSLLLLGCADDGSATSTASSETSSSNDSTSATSSADSTSTDTSSTNTDTDSTDTGSTTDDLPLEPICPTELTTQITASAIAEHLVALDEIASTHAGNRAAGTAGYEASAAYVEAKLQAAGYETSRWPFSFDRYTQLSDPTLIAVSDPPTVYTPDVEFAAASWSPSGSVAGVIEAVDLELGLANASTSGCQVEDWAGFTPGRVALVQRGSCPFVTKVANAEAAGALAVVLFNQGDTEARLGLFGGSLGSQNTLTIPVLFSSYAVGVELDEAAMLASTIVELSVDGGIVATDTFNVIAETSGGDPDHVVMLGAHLDSVPAGPGVNDNGSGSATVLEIALQFAACTPNQRVRFAWWGAEEWGLHGSRRYVEDLDDDALARLALYLNFDMLASPNYVRFIHDGAGGPEGSTLIYERFLEWFDEQGLSTSGAAFAGNSDYQPFVDAGVPSGGLATGAGGSKSQAQVDNFGGTIGEPYDSCYHQACDDQDNFDLEVLGQNATATAYVLERWATDLGPLAQTPDVVTSPAPTDVTAAPDHECGHVHE